MNEVVYNTCFGGFSFSDEACRRLLELGAANADDYGSRNVTRHDPLVVQVVKEMGDKANGGSARLSIITIKGNKYRIREYDGQESVMEPADQVWIVIEVTP
jgi:hypothetical protein